MIKGILNKVKKIIIGALIGISIFSASAFCNHVTYAAPNNEHTISEYDKTYQIPYVNKPIIKQVIKCEIGKPADIDADEYYIDKFENDRVNLLEEVEETLKKGEEQIKQQQKITDEIIKQERIIEQHKRNENTETNYSKMSNIDVIHDNQRERMIDESIEALESSKAQPPKKDKFIGGWVGDFINEEESETDKVMSAKSSWLGKKLYKGLSNAINTLFSFMYETVIKTPQVLVQNTTITKLYFTIVILATMALAINVVYGQFSSILSGEDSVSFLNMLFSIFKNVTYMFGFAWIFPKVIQIINILAEQLLLLGQKEVELNTVLSILESGGVISVGNYLLSFIMLALLMVVFLFIFFQSCARYWDICKLFVTAPMAFASNVNYKTSGAFYSWVGNMKQVLLTQISYAIHLAIFGSIMIAPIPEGAKMMLMIGGIVGLFKLSGNVRSLFQKSNAEQGVAGMFKKFMKVI